MKFAVVRQACVWLFCVVGSAMTSMALASEPVDVNTADAETIASALDGVGLAKARAIVAYRNANGAFLTIESLANVKGIGERTVEANRDNILVGGTEDESTGDRASGGTSDD